MINTKKLVMVTPIEVETLWIGEIQNLPLKVVEDNMPFDNREWPEEPGYPHVGDAAAIHAALLSDGSETVAGWTGSDVDDEACWFEWRDLDPDLDDEDD